MRDFPEIEGSFDPAGRTEIEIALDFGKDNVDLLTTPRALLYVQSKNVGTF